jgi:hypothetical protein
MMIRAHLRCTICGEPIGAYEPLIEEVRGSARETSLAAEAGLSRFGARHCHAACYAAELEEPAASVHQASPGHRPQ